MINDPISLAAGIGAGQESARVKSDAAVDHVRIVAEIDAIKAKSAANQVLHESEMQGDMLAMAAFVQIKNLRNENQYLANENQTLAAKVNHLETEISKRWIPYGVTLKASLIARKVEREVLIDALKELDPTNVAAIAKKADEASDAAYAAIGIPEINKIVRDESTEDRQIRESKSKTI